GSAISMPGGNRFFCSSENGTLSTLSPQPRIDLARKSFDPAQRLVVLEKPGLAHDQEMPEAADAVVHLLDLSKDLLGRARKLDAGLDRLVRGRVRSLGGVWSTAAPRRICACTGVGT